VSVLNIKTAQETHVPSIVYLVHIWGIDASCLLNPAYDRSLMASMSLESPGLLPHVPMFAHGLQMACVLFHHHIPLAYFYLLVLFLPLVLVEKILPRMPVALGYSTVG
jgi:hypothetical protein